jgi:hypothetical protein
VCAASSVDRCYLNRRGSPAHENHEAGFMMIPFIGEGGLAHHGAVP